MTAFAQPELTDPVLLHRSRHVDTVRASWRGGAAVIAKQVRADLLESGDAELVAHARRQVLHEGDLLRRVRHPHIMRGLALYEDPATLVLELAPGRNLREELRARRILPPAETVAIGTQLATALATMHGAGLMHRDVKPANVMYLPPAPLAPARSVLIDLHLAREIGDMKGGAGTRLFIAPEQVRGGTVGAAADVWSLGVVLYRCATGRLPFRGAEGHPQLEKRPAPSLARLASSRFEGDVAVAALHLPRTLAMLIDSMLAYEPVARPTTGEIVRVLANVPGVRRAAA